MALVLPYRPRNTHLEPATAQRKGVTKLKLVKRSMYVRGKFNLLRQRVLYAAS